MSARAGSGGGGRGRSKRAGGKVRKRRVFASGKASWLSLYSERKWVKRYAVLRGTVFQMFNSQKDAQPKLRVDMQGCDVSPQEPKARKRHCFKIVDHARPEAPPVHLAAETVDEAEAWLSLLLCACVPTRWPGGADLLGRPVPLLASRVSEQSMASKTGPIPKLPRFKKVPIYVRRALFLKKLRLCSVVFDVEEAFKSQQDIKRQTLLELVEFCEHTRGSIFTDFRVLSESVTMVRLNLFRPLANDRPMHDEIVEEEEYADPQWHHISVVYEFFRDLVTFDIDLAAKKKVVDSSFISQLVPLFNSQDPRERDVLKAVVHRTYSKLTQRRALIRRCICNSFYEFCYETHQHNGIAEMLEILASVINGFTVPIKKDHEVMLKRALLPLHKSRYVAAYHGHLSYCMALFVAKDRGLVEPIINALVRYWPVGNSGKAVMFLNEMEDLIENIELDQFVRVSGTVTRLLVSCINSEQFQLAERALFMWNAEAFCNFVLHPSVAEATLPGLLPALVGAANSHWHEGVASLAALVLSMYEQNIRAVFAVHMELVAKSLGEEAVSRALQAAARAAEERQQQALEGTGPYERAEYDTGVDAAFIDTPAPHSPRGHPRR